jgi:hypothetical protein
MNDATLRVSLWLLGCAGLAAAQTKQSGVGVCTSRRSSKWSKLAAAPAM